MLFQRIESEGLAHYSYLVGDRQEAFVIDPRRDCDIYLEETEKKGFRIKFILETHRNEDYLSGSKELAEKTGADIWHADPEFGYLYGMSARNGYEWKAGRLKLLAIESPGHTPGLMSYLLCDYGSNPWILFSGDSLFAGDVGRVDLSGPCRIREMAGLMYETLFNRLLPLGDQIIVCPAHGAGSICAASIVDRVWTTIGLERLYNPKLQFKGKREFIANIGRQLEVPPYFRKMEEWNLDPPILGSLPIPQPLSSREFLTQSKKGTVLDTRSEQDFGAAHIPGALSIWLEGVPNFAGWFIPYDRPIFLVGQSDDHSQAVRMLVRMGYDNFGGSLAGGMLAWHMAGLDIMTNGTEPVQALCGKIDVATPDDTLFILDVRSAEELGKEGRIRLAHNIHITQLPQHLEEIPKDRPVHIFCGSGLRSSIAASILQREKWGDVNVVLGGMAAWKSHNCPVDRVTNQ